LSPVILARNSPIASYRTRGLRDENRLARLFSSGKGIGGGIFSFVDSRTRTQSVRGFFASSRIFTYFIPGFDCKASPTSIHRFSRICAQCVAPFKSLTNGILKQGQGAHSVAGNTLTWCYSTSRQPDICCGDMGQLRSLKSVSQENG
jgi:hypothetical protein